jgi:hypothetical protein
VIDLLDRTYLKATDFLAVALEKCGLDSRRLRLSTTMILTFCHRAGGIDFLGILSDANRRAYDDAVTDLVCLRDKLTAATLPVSAAQSGAPADGDPFYKPAFFKKWNIGDELLRRNATDAQEYAEGKVRRQRKQPSSTTAKSPAQVKRGKGDPRPVYWYSEPDARRRWPEKFAGGKDSPSQS